MSTIRVPSEISQQDDFTVRVCEFEYMFNDSVCNLQYLSVNEYEKQIRS